MIYPDSFETKTGFISVRNDILALAFTDEGRDLCQSMTFSADAKAVKTALTLTAEMQSIIAAGTVVALDRVKATGSTIRRISIPGSFLTASELSSLRSTLEAINEIRSSILHFNGATSDSTAPSCPSLAAMAENLLPVPECMKAINAVLDRFGNVKDNASPALFDIRRQLGRLQSSLNSSMRRVVQNGIKDGILDADTVPSVRDGRLVIPVAPMNKRKVAGIVHDESASGKTVYIEPAEIVETNNRIREMEMEEKREIINILTAVADILRENQYNILDSIDTIGQIDFIHAKAKYCHSIGANMPSISTKPQIEWYGATHPVLLKTLAQQDKDTVPLDISLTPKNRILVISGPNAGGKSVCIKTVAIVQYMIQCGILPPMHSNSHVGIFSDIMIDIGDDQSIEDDLSTYSSHLRNMKTMLRYGRNTSLLIIDEMGSGTEPTMGGAIAQAILKSLNNKKCWGVVTTHYQNLKNFAGETPGLINGSMLYDRQLMKPLFKLSIGNAGSSFAIEIARKSGIPADIISDAEEIVGTDYINLDKYLLDIARDKRYWENKRTSIKQKEKKLDNVLEQYEANAAELREKRKEILADARKEAEKILETSNASIERAIHDIRRAQAEKERTLEARRKLNQQKEALVKENTKDEHPLLQKAPKSKRPKQAPSTPATRQLTAGDIVKLEGQSTPGRIIEISGDNAVVAFGMMKTTVKTSRLRPSDAKISSGADRHSHTIMGSNDMSRQRQLDFKTEIDLRGMRVDEAVQAVTYFIDDASQFGISRVRILHGTGTGALRQYIRQYLATVPIVASMHDEDVRFGGAGITVVELK